MNKKFIAITIGDINGIGIELLTKLFIEKKIRNFILFTNFKLLNDYLKKNKLEIKVRNIKKSNILPNESSVFYIYDFKAKNNLASGPTAFRVGEFLIISFSIIVATRRPSGYLSCLSREWSKKGFIRSL